MNEIVGSLDTPSRRKKRDHRPIALGLTLITIIASGYLVQQLPGGNQVRSTPESQSKAHLPLESLTSAQGPSELKLSPAPLNIDPREAPSQHQQEATAAEIKQRFDQTILMMHAQRYDEALTALHRIIQLKPDMPAAYINMGFAFLGKDDYRSARDFFMVAIDLNPSLANAHYGIAIAYEGLGDLESALGGMRGFLHLTEESDPNQIHVARARSALWEWEARLGRGPWGPTKGIPPGLTQEQIRRDGRGMGTMVPVKGAKNDDGSTQFVIKHSDPFPEQFQR